MIGQIAEDSNRAKQKSMLDILLEKKSEKDEKLWNYYRLARYLGIGRNTLTQYRTGKREFRLNWEQILKLKALIEEVGFRMEDLPLDWYRDINEEEN